MHTILHITPHLGGGVGSVLLNYLEKVKGSTDFTHKVMCLEYANEKAKSASKTTGFFLADNMFTQQEVLHAAISQVDIVLVHWWNHPLLNAWLVREVLPPARIIFWSHISGFHAPYIFNEQALHYPDLFVFTSPLSMDVQEVKNLREERQRMLRVIWSTGGVEHTASINPKSHFGFNIGYIGTVDYSKLHPQFLKMCSNINLPGVRFITCGGPSDKQIQKESMQYGDIGRFTFTGQISDIRDYLSEFDVFGYPLAPYHYGTCEQALGESMAAGVPPVVMANPCESHIVESGVTGIVAQDEESYVKALEGLYHNPDLRKQLADNARKASREKYSLDLMARRWEQVFYEVLGCHKTPRQWMGKHHGKSVPAAHVFIESLGEYGKEFENSLTAQNEKEKNLAMAGIIKLYGSSHLWKADTRGTPNHYHLFFPEDNDLKLWRDLAAVENKNTNDISDVLM
jgi:L-malate glycosyltransferase